jgi:hypothetical protein
MQTAKSCTFVVQEIRPSFVRMPICNVSFTIRYNSFGEANGIERSLLKVGLSQEVELVDSTREQQLGYDLATRSGGGANRGGSIIFHNAFVLYLVTPEEHNGNRLNSIAVVFDVEAVIE